MSRVLDRPRPLRPAYFDDHVGIATTSHVCEADKARVDDDQDREAHGDHHPYADDSLVSGDVRPVFIGLAQGPPTDEGTKHDCDDEREDRYREDKQKLKCFI